MEGREFLSVAQSLLARSEGPAFIRSAISRAYYGAYHYTCYALERFGCSKTAADRNHGTKWQALCRAESPEVKAAGQKLNDLHECRRKADYDLRRQDVERIPNADEALRNARDVIRWLGVCEKEDPAKGIGATLKKAGFD